jgi:hypothetical protein
MIVRPNFRSIPYAEKNELERKISGALFKQHFEQLAARKRSRTRGEREEVDGCVVIKPRRFAMADR